MASFEPKQKGALHLASPRGRLLTIPRPTPARATVSPLAPEQIRNHIDALQVLQMRWPRFTRAWLQYIRTRADRLQPKTQRSGRG